MCFHFWNMLSHRNVLPFSKMFFNDYLISLKHTPKIKTNTTCSCSHICFLSKINDYVILLKQIKKKYFRIYHKHPMTHIDSIPFALGFDKVVCGNILFCLHLNICWYIYYFKFHKSLQLFVGCSELSKNVSNTETPLICSCNDMPL